MWTDIIELRDFYHSSTGRVTGRLIRRAVREMWPTVAGERVLGLGYTTPFLPPFMGEAERVASMMPAAMGVLRWPGGREPNLATLVDELDLPLAARSVDCLLLVHALEFADHTRGMLRECWRVLADGGRMLLVVPNRRGAWARLERSPFANGQPYSQGQINRLLRDNMFTPMRSGGALFLPPTPSRMMLGSAPAIERLGARWFPGFGGVLVVEASKQIYAGTVQRVEVRRRLPVALPEPLRPSRGV